jgi:hypothetical protein
LAKRKSRSKKPVIEESEVDDESEQEEDSEEVEESESGNEADEDDSIEESTTPEPPAKTKQQKPAKAPTPEPAKTPAVLTLKSFPTQILICGPTEAGKTNSIKYIVKNIAKKFHYIIVFCATARLNKDYDFLPNAFVLDYSRAMLEAIMRKQEEYKENGKNIHCLIIFDDIVGRVKTHNNDLFDQLASSSRHSLISIIYVTQQVTKISPAIRNNVQTVLATQINKTESDLIYERCKCIGSKGEFWNIVNTQVNPHLYKFIALQGNKYTALKFPLCRPYKIKYKY